MTINLADNNPRKAYTVTAGSTQSTFTVDFEFFVDADLDVFVDGVQKTLATDYTVTGGNGSTGAVNMSITASGADVSVVITRSIAIERTTDFPSSGPFDIASLNLGLDKIIAIQADLNDSIDRSLRLTAFDTDAALTLPDVNTRKGKLLAFNATTGAVEAGATISGTTTVAAVAADIQTLADIQDGTTATNAITKAAAIDSNISLVAAVDGDVTKVATIDSDVTTVAGQISPTNNISAVAAKATEIGRLGTADAVADMNTLGTSAIVADMDTLADIAGDITTVAGKASLITSDFVSDLNALAVTDVINDINTLATSDIVSDLNTLATTDIVSDLNTLATSDIVSDINTLATSDIVTDLNLLATSDFVSDLNTMATSTNVSDLNTVAGDISNINTLAGINGNITTVAGINSQVTTLSSISSDVTSLANAIGVATTYAVTVVGGVFYLDGASNPALTLTRGNTYIFDQSDSSNAGHPLAFRDSSDNSYTTGVTVTGTAGQAGAKVQIDVASNAPASLKYYCTVHGNGMGNTITVVNSNLATVASNISSVNTVASANTNIGSVAGAVANINTLATGSNLDAINGFAARYRVGASDPTTSLDAGDLFFNTSTNLLKRYNGTAWITIASGLTSVAGDASPALGGNLDVNGNSIVSTSNGNISITPNGSGKVILDGLSHPTSDGSAGQFLKTDGSGNLSFSTVSNLSGELVNDSSPQLGGNLDLNSNNITGTGNIPAANLTGTLPAIDGSALTGISSGATVYDGIANLPTSATEGASAFVRANNTFYVRGNGQWQATNSLGTKPLQQQFLPDSSITSDGSNLGRDVHISSDGQTAAATAHADDNPTNNQGSVNIYQKQSDGTFAFFQRIVASDAQSSDFFGSSAVYVSDNGLYLAVGAKAEDQNGSNSGAVYVFYRANITSNFAQQAKLDPSDGAFNDEFGISVAFNADATYLVGGAEGEYGTPYQGTDTGAAYVFTRSGTTWTEQAKLNASDLAVYDKFGCSVHINDDGTYIAVGAEGESRQNNFTSSGLGAVYIFTRSGTTWSQQTKITGTASSPVNSTGEFGSGVCFDGGANTLAVGAHFSDGSISNCGAAYVFTRSGTTWTQQAQLIDDQVSTSTFGADVRMNKDGSVLAVSANQDDGDGANGGAVYVFDRKGDYTQWELRNKLYHYPTDGTSRGSDYLGETVAIDNAGTTIMSGAYSQDQQSSNGGAVYFFTNTFTNTNTTGTGPYGTSISNLNLRRGSLIEEVSGICDGRIVRAESGVYTMPLVTSTQALTTSFAAMTGSEITYFAPPGTKRVKYNLQVKLSAIVNSGISSYKLFVDDVEVTKFRNSRAFNYSSSEHGNLYQDFEWTFDCDGTADAATGTFAGWNGPKTIRMEANEYSSSYQMELHKSGWFGNSGATGDDVLAEPILTITAYA